jgi:hypothetical protein
MSKKNNYPFKNKKRGNYSARNTGSYNPQPQPTIILYYPQVLYVWGLRIAENSGMIALESYKNRIPENTDLNSEDKGFWEWTRTIDIPLFETSNVLEAQALLIKGHGAFCLLKASTIQGGAR